MRAGLKRIAATVMDLGFDPRRLRSVGRLPRYLSDLSRFQKAGGTADYLMPMLADYDDAAGVASGHYFHQDLLVAQFIHQAAPRRHADVGSRIDGFVAHVAAFRQIDVFDIRPLISPNPNVRFLQADITGNDLAGIEPYDSVSCLHAAEHLGLGRYGDPIDPEGHRRGFDNLATLCAPGGALYISVPIGRAGTYFNAHRVFEPGDVPAFLKDRCGLVRYDYVDDSGALHTEQRISDTPRLEYGLGIYSLRHGTAA